MGIFAESYTWYTPVVIPLRFLLLCSLLIPQSLKVTSDFMKYFISTLISKDKLLYDAKTNTPATVSSSDTAEDLGQIEYLFTDKTGTLTQNVMEFKKCIVNGKMYEKGIAAESLIEHCTMRDEMEQGNNSVIEFMRTLALCNTVFSSISYVFLSFFHFVTLFWN